MSSKLRSKERENMSDAMHKKIISHGGIAKKVEPKMVPYYLIPEIGPMQKQVNRLEQLYSRRAWRKGR